MIRICRPRTGVKNLKWRREAGLLGVKLTGTTGILKRAVREKLVSPKPGDRLLEIMRAPGYYAGVSSLRDIPD
jgi:predicted nucleic acid-binding protein